MRATAGRINDALHGYREAIDYFARTGNWKHQWTTLRHLADLLRRLGDDEPAATSQPHATAEETDHDQHDRHPAPLRPPTTGEPAGTPGHVITDAAELGTVLGVWAHPDDETLLAGGLLAAARDAGSRVVCVTATLGEHGTDDPRAWPPERLGRVRGHELTASLAALGVVEHHLLGVTDGTCAEQPHEVLVQRLARLVTAVQPDTIVTFGPDGLTGHEDHQTVSAWTTAARAVASPAARLLYVTTTAEFVESRKPARDAFDVFLTEGLPLRTPSSAPAVRLHLPADELDRKMVALRAQASQMSTLIAAVGETFVSADAVADWTGSTPEWGTWRVAA